MKYRCKLCGEIVEFRPEHLLKKHPEVKFPEMLATLLENFDPIIEKGAKSHWIFGDLPERSPLVKHPKYLEFLERYEQLERELKELPVVGPFGVNYAQLMLSRTICMAKEICKWAMKGDYHWLVDNQHILEEVSLLQKDMENLKHDVKVEKERKQEEWHGGD